MADEYLTPFENDFRARRTHLAMLFHLARADDRHHINEDKMIREIAKRLEVGEEELEEIRNYPENFDYAIPTNEDERNVYLYHFLFLMRIDGEVSDEERKVVEELGMRLGAHPQMVEDMISIMKEHEAKPLPDHLLLEALRRYKN